MRGIFGKESSLAVVGSILIMGGMLVGLFYYSLALSTTVARKYLPAPTVTPFDIDAMRTLAKREEASRKRMIAEKKSGTIRVSGIETLGTDLRPLYDLKLPDTVYLHSVGAIIDCFGESKCPNIADPLYAFRSIETVSGYSIDSALNEFFWDGNSHELSEAEKETVRQYFPGIMEQIKNIVESPPVSSQYYSINDMAPDLRADEKVMLEFHDIALGYRAVFVDPEKLDEVLDTINKDPLINISLPD